MKKYLAFTIVISLAITGICGADWPQYLGPDRNATSEETGLKHSWPEDGPEVQWRGLSVMPTLFRTTLRPSPSNIPGPVVTTVIALAALEQLRLPPERYYRS